MLITNIGSMGVCKSAMLIYFHLYIKENIKDINSDIYTAYYDKNRSFLPANSIVNPDIPKIQSRIYDCIDASLINNKTIFLSLKDKINIFSVDEAQFLEKGPFDELIKKAETDTVLAYGLNTDYQNIIWPRTRELCKKSDFIYIHDGEFAYNFSPRNSNYMKFDGKFDLDYKNGVDFDGCTEEEWYLNAIKYFKKTLEEYNFDIDLMLESREGLVSSFIKLFQMWEDLSNPLQN